jgi:drug/metabolite transporter (DMT)-like permease
MTPPIPARAWLGDFLLLAALWGGSFLFMRLGATEFGPVPTAGLRVAIAALVLLPVLLTRGHGPALRRDFGRILASGVLNSAIPFALYSYAVLHVTTGTASIVNATVPLFGAVLAWLWLGERLGWQRWCGLALGFAGVALLASRSGAAPGAPAAGAGTALPIAACLAACACYGTAASYAKRHLGGVPPIATATGSLLGAALALALPTAWLWPARMPGPTAWLAIVAMGIFCTALAYVLYFRLIARAGPSRALAVTFLAPVFAVAYGALLLAEPVTPWMVGCGAVVLAGTLVSTGLLRLGRRVPPGPAPGRAPGLIRAATPPRSRPGPGAPR